MEFNQNVPVDHLYFSAYGQGWVEVAEVRYALPISIDFTTIRPLTGDFVSLSEADFASVIQAKPELLIIGCGDGQQFLHPRLTAYLSGFGVGVETMTTQSACRTYNLVKGEGRKVWIWLHLH